MLDERTALPLDYPPWAALRVGEVLGIPLAAIAPMRARVRGPEEWQWPDEGTLRSWAKRAPKGLVKTRLTDDPRRVGLIVDEDAETCG